jgi:hypothetical protein
VLGLALLTAVGFIANFLQGIDVLRKVESVERKLERRTDALSRKLIASKHREEQMAGELDALRLEVEENTTVVGSAVTLLAQLKAMLDEAIVNEDWTAVKALSETLSVNTDALAAAVAANTPGQ